MSEHEDPIEQLRRDITTLLQVFRIDNALGSESKYAKLNASDLSVLIFTGENQSVTMGQLAHILNASNSTLTSVIDRLIRKKLVLRKHSKKDRRVVNIKLSAEGKRLYHSIVERQYQNTAAILDILDGDEQVLLMGMIRKVAAFAETEMVGD